MWACPSNLTASLAIHCSGHRIIPEDFPGQVLQYQLL